MPESLPSHASPVIAPIARPSAQYLTSWADLENTSQPSTPGIPANLISPAYTPPLTPSISSPGTPSGHHHSRNEPKSIPVDTSLDALDPSIKQPRLLPKLPKVECIVRARIPTTSGAEMFLHLYSNDSDNKEHLAIVFGDQIRSRSLDEEKPDETEWDRMMRGAYVGRLRPGRTSSRRDDEEDLRRKILRRPADGMKGRKRSGSALKNVETLPDVQEGEQLNVEGTTQTEGEIQSESQSQKKIEPQSSPSSPSSQQQQQPPTQLQNSMNTENNTASQVASTAPSTSTTTAQAQPTSSSTSSPTLTTPSKPPLVRIHSECYTGETAWSARCDCGEQLDEAARLMSTISPLNPIPGGVIVYLRQEGRGIGLASKLKAYNLQDLGSDTVEANLLLRHPADARSYGLATAILVDLGLGTDTEHDEEGQNGEGEIEVSQSQTAQSRGIRLLTNNPDKVRAVEGPGREVRVVERVAMVPIAWRTHGQRGVKGEELSRYLETKIGRMGHMIHEP